MSVIIVEESRLKLNKEKTLSLISYTGENNLFIHSRKKLILIFEKNLNVENSEV